jgi:hypothetical protein
MTQNKPASTACLAKSPSHDIALSCIGGVFVFCALSARGIAYLHGGLTWWVPPHSVSDFFDEARENGVRVDGWPYHQG